MRKLKAKKKELKPQKTSKRGGGPKERKGMCGHQRKKLGGEKNP